MDLEVNVHAVHNRPLACGLVSVGLKLHANRSMCRDSCLSGRLSLSIFHSMELFLRFIHVVAWIQCQGSFFFKTENYFGVQTVLCLPILPP